jgi:L-malate glycosyltransferase
MLTNIPGTDAILEAVVWRRARVLVARASGIYGRGQNGKPFREDDDWVLGSTRTFMANSHKLESSALTSDYLANQDASSSSPTTTRSTGRSSSVRADGGGHPQRAVPPDARRPDHSAGGGAVPRGRGLNGAPARPVRVTFLVGSLDIGGAERQLARLASNLDRARFRPSVIVWYGGGALASELPSDVAVTHLAMKQVRTTSAWLRPLLAARLVWRLVAAIREQRPDILNAYMFTAYVLGAIAARIAGVRVVVASRRALVSYHSYPRRWRLVARLANRLIDLHLCNSEAVRWWAIEKEGLALERTEVVHNGLDIQPALTAPDVPAEWRAGAGVLAAVVANFIHYKDHPTLFRAVAQVTRAHPDFRVVLFGDGPQRVRLEAMVRDLAIDGAVVFAGRTPNAPELLSVFDLALLTSVEEGFSNAVMEAMAQGLPIVATAVGGVLELVRDHVEGRLVAAGDADALAAAISELIRDPAARRRMGAAGRQRIANEFGVRRMVERTEAVYERLLFGPAPAVAAVTESR